MPAIVAAGGRALSSMGGGLVMVTTTSDGTPDNALALDADAKVSGALTDSGHFLIVFHDDVEDAAAGTILQKVGLVSTQNPDLLPHQFLAAGTQDQAFAAAQWDEVAYIYPASEEIVNGRPVYGCAGPLTDFGNVGQYISTFGEGWDGPGRGSIDLTYSFARLTEKLPRSVVQR